MSRNRGRRRWVLVVSSAVVLAALLNVSLAPSFRPASVPADASRDPGPPALTMATEHTVGPARARAVARKALAARKTRAPTVTPTATTTATAQAPTPTATAPPVPTAVTEPAVSPAPAPATVAAPTTTSVVTTLVAEVEADGIDPGPNWSWSMGNTATLCGTIPDAGIGTGCTSGAAGAATTVFSGSPTMALVAHEVANAETENDAVPSLVAEVTTAEAGTSWSPIDAVASCLVEHFMGFQDQAAGTWQCPVGLAATVAADIHDPASTAVGDVSN